MKVLSLADEFTCATPLPVTDMVFVGEKTLICLVNPGMICQS